MAGKLEWALFDGILGYYQTWLVIRDKNPALLNTGKETKP